MYDKDGNIAQDPILNWEKQLWLNTHDESVFYANDRWKTQWSHASNDCKPQAKGEGTSIMVSDFLSPDYGQLKTDKRCVSFIHFSTVSELVPQCSDACILLKPGKNRDGYFSNEDLIEQTSNAIDIFEELQPDGQMLIIFDNATTHHAHSSNALSALYIPLHPRLWVTKKQTICMRDASFITGELQSLYYPDNHSMHPGWFKGMKVILQERGIHLDKKTFAQCNKDAFGKCQDKSLASKCCYRRVLYNQKDFRDQKGALQELVEARGHICDFYPKFHQELNFIEQYWGAYKYSYRSTAPSSNIKVMENIMIECLDNIPLIQIQRYVILTCI